jgi:penicillin-binding protein 1A
LGHLAPLLHFAAAHGPAFGVGLAAGLMAALLLRLRLLRWLVAAALLVVLLLVSADAAFAFDIIAAAKSAWRYLAPHPALLPGAGLSFLLTLLFGRRRRVPRPLPRPGRLRRRTIVPIAAVLGMVALEILAPRMIDASLNAPVLDLPDAGLVKATLDHCQIVHDGTDSTADLLLCPQLLGPAGFSDWLRKTVIASEDRNFLYHGAVDIHGTLRAALSSVRGNLEGGSTLTQQLARILFLRRDAPMRKLYEAALAQRIFDVASQQDILNAYMNVAPLPRNLYGFDAASRYFFGVRASDLRLGEAALLVGMLPYPNGRDVTGGKDHAVRSAHQQQALAAAAHVLDAMVAQQLISRSQASKALAEMKTRIATGRLRRGRLQPLTVEFRPYRDEALAVARAAGAAAGGEVRLVVEMDPRLQSAVVDATGIMAADHQGAGIVMQPTGEVLALSSGRIYQGSWNRATVIERSIGSAGKIFPLIAATSSGLTMATSVSTAPIAAGGWPREPDSACTAQPTVTLRTALAYSCNRPFVRLTDRYHTAVAELLGKFGFNPPSQLNLTPIGGIETSPEQLARAYAAIGNKGLLPTPRYLLAVIGPSGNVLAAPDPSPPVRVISAATADAVLADLRLPVKYGTATAADSKYAAVYGKTGTSSDDRDAVFVGIVRDFVGAFWQGDDHMQSVAGAHGGGAPAVAFRRVVDGYYRGQLAVAPAVATDPGWFDAQAVLRAAIQYLAAAGFFSIVSAVIVGALLDRRSTGAATPEGNTRDPEPAREPPPGEPPAEDDGKGGTEPT